MYLRRHDKMVDGERYGYWSLVESVRTARGPRQRIVATIGKLPGLAKEERIGWEEIRRIVTGTPREPELFERKRSFPHGPRLISAASASNGCAILAMSIWASS